MDYKAIELRERRREDVINYFNNTDNEEIRALMPGSPEDMETALSRYVESISAVSKSYGRVIFINDLHIGDIWCYGIDEEEKSAMISFCIFHVKYRRMGIMKYVLPLFLDIIKEKYLVKTIGAFTYSSNLPSLNLLKGSGFKVLEKIEGEGIKSCYLEKKI